MDHFKEGFEDNKGVIRIRQIEEGQTTQWPKGKGQKDKQRSAKHTHKIKDWVTPTPLKTGSELDRVTRTPQKSGGEFR